MPGTRPGKTKDWASRRERAMNIHGKSSYHEVHARFLQRGGRVLDIREQHFAQLRRVLAFQLPSR